MAIWHPDSLRIWPTPFLSLLECKEDSMDNSVTQPFGFELSQFQWTNLNSTKVQSYSFDLKFYVPSFLSPNFLRIWMVQSKCGELTFEIVDPLPEVWHQAFYDVLEPSTVYEINLLCQWCSRACRLLEYREVRQFVTLIYLVTGGSKMMNALSDAE